MKLSTAARVLVLGVSAVAASAPASAEVTRTTDDSFVSRNEVVVEATPKEVWLALISPATWWQSAHTWSGDAKNLALVPQAGGCFCETIPEVDEPGRFTLEGSVEHMRVIQAYPETALRMVGNLGPLQSEPVNGILTIAISEVMYNPPGTAGALEEFVEIYNFGDAAVDLTGWAFTKGVDFTFPAGTLIPGRSYLAVPANSAAPRTRHPFRRKAQENSPPSNAPPPHRPRAAARSHQHPAPRRCCRAARALRGR